MKLLIGGSPSKIFHLKEFADELKKLEVDCKLVVDTDFCRGFPSRKITDWFQNNKKFEQLISDFKPDMILVDRQRHFALTSSKYDIPLIIHLRGDIWKEFEWAKNTLYKSILKKIVLKIWISIARKTFQKSSLIIPICQHLEKIVKNNYPNKKTGIMYQGIDPSKWYPTKGMTLKHPCVGLLQGAVIWGKTQEMLILQNVLKSMPNVTFYWAGDGPYRDKILSILKKYDNFVWLGPLEYPDKVREYLTEIDVYLLTTGIDMSPLTLQEAQLMKKPVIATNVGGVSELMIDKKTGYLVDKGDWEDIVSKISTLVKNKKKSEEMGNQGEEFIKNNFNWTKIAEEFLKIIKNI